MLALIVASLEDLMVRMNGFGADAGIDHTLQTKLKCSNAY